MSLTPSEIERIKYSATFFNAIAAGLLVSGVIVPIIGAVYAGSVIPRWNWGVGVTIQVVLIGFAAALHVKALDKLKELDR